MGLLTFFFGDTSNIGLTNRSDKHLWIEQKIKMIPPNETILDAGAGECQFKKHCTHLQYTSQDFNQYDGKGNGVGVQVGSWDRTKIDIVGDITNINVANSSFDNILCTEVFQHIPDPIKAMKEFSRILKPGGKLILTAPFCSITHFAPYHFYSGYNKYFFTKFLTDFGFDIIELSPNGNYFEYLAQELRHTTEVAKKYSNLKLSLMEKIAQKILLNFYKKASERDTKSSELLNYGFLIVAIKK